ncbi:MAG: DNA-processing protein DprA [Alphaproteobacteria bacterium]|nr:DNA-processing protein DprA [Alphaproteobacteria bacterium]
MATNNLADYIRLILTDGVGPVSFYKFLSQYGSATEALKALSFKKEVCSPNRAQDELKKAQNAGVEILSFEDERYPLSLKELNDAPPILYAKGNLDLLSYVAGISIVGSRNASVQGRKIASRIAYDLTNADVLVVSGMARGIDSAAHKGAMYAKSEQGPTIAVLGTGVDICYPKENEELYHQIAAQGLLISEFALSEQANISNFPRRNRIVSALSLGVLVVEASLNSGSLITARLALEQGKDVFAVPDSPIENKSAGCNKLIKEGALLTENADDILQTLALTQNRTLKTFQNASLKSKPLDNKKKEDNITEQKKSDVKNADILQIIGTSGIETDELIRHLKADASDVLVLITELELEGLVSKTNGSFLKLTKQGLKVLK